MTNNPWMQWMQSWQTPFSNPSVVYDQNVSPVTTWFSPTYELNYAGDPAIEAKITKDVASFGKQLGILTEAILELADGEPDEATERLRNLADQIEQIKTNIEEAAPNHLSAALKALKETDKQAFDKLMSEFR